MQQVKGIITLLSFDHLPALLPPLTSSPRLCSSPRLDSSWTGTGGGLPTRPVSQRPGPVHVEGCSEVLGSRLQRLRPGPGPDASSIQHHYQQHLPWSQAASASALASASAAHHLLPRRPELGGGERSPSPVAHRRRSLLLLSRFVLSSMHQPPSTTERVRKLSFSHSHTPAHPAYGRSPVPVRQRHAGTSLALATTTTSPALHSPYTKSINIAHSHTKLSPPLLLFCPFLALSLSVSLYFISLFSLLSFSASLPFPSFPGHLALYYSLPSPLPSTRVMPEPHDVRDPDRPHHQTTAKGRTHLARLWATNARLDPLPY